VKLFIIGPLPPPFGGISNHIQRIKPFLDEQNINYSVINQYGDWKVLLLLKIFYILIVKKNVHIHLFSKYLLIPLFIISNISRGKKFILTIHNDRLIGHRFFHFLVTKSRFFKVLVVSKRSVKYWSCNTKNEVTYLPVFTPYGGKLIKSFAKTRVIANVWSYYDGVVNDYGVDILAQFIHDLPDIAFSLYVGDEESREAFDAVLPRSSNLQVFYGKNLVKEFGTSDIFLRLNREDAYGVSIVEAMCCGIPSLVTGVCQRPLGALVFSNYDTLYKKLVEIIHCDVSDRSQYLKGFVEPTYHLKLIDIYKIQLGIL
jgi:glycosyltransferase involved in cell wall biosynthesis